MNLNLSESSRGKGMRDRQDILMRYKKSDICVRLHLFLQCRDLRDEFLTIERGEAPDRKLKPGFWGERRRPFGQTASGPP